MIWTRAVSDWGDDAVFLANYQGKVLRIPCLSIVPLLPALQPKTYPHVVVTSANALKLLERSAEWQRCLRTAVFHCFGAVTHAALLARNLDVEQHQADGAAALCAQLIATLPRATEVAVLSAQEPAFPLTENLQQNGIKADKLIFYRTDIVARWADGSELQPQQCEELGREKHLVCFASPSAVLGLVARFKDCAARWQENFHALTIGATTAAVANQYFEGCDTCVEQTVAGLIATACGKGSSPLRK